MDGARENASVAAAASLTILGTTCCALPMVLVALGAGGAMASMASALPWLVALSKYKLATFGLTAAALGYSWWRVRALAVSCYIGDARRPQVGEKKLKEFFRQRRVLPGDRDRVPLVVTGDRIVWVVGHRIGHPFRLREETTRVWVLRAKQK